MGADQRSGATVRQVAAVLAVALAFLVVSIASASAGGPTTGAQPTSGQPASAAPSDPELICDSTAAPDAGAPTGTTQRVGDLDVTVTETSFQPKIDDFFDEGYLQVDFEITNIGDSTHDYDGFQSWALLDLDPAGRYPTPLDSTSTINAFTIEPGDVVEGHVTFAVGYTGGNYRIRYQDTWFSADSDEAFWATRVEGRPGPAAQETPTPTPSPGFENVSSYDIAVTINDDGSATFVETIHYDFGSLQRHGIFRDLVLAQRCNDRYDRVYPLHAVSVTSPTGAPAQYSIEDLPAGKRIKIGDPDRTVSGAQTYVVTYTLDGTLNGFADHDELYWNVVGNGWGVSIYDLHVVVDTPGEVTQVACYAGEFGSRARCDRAVIGAEGEARFRQGYLGPYQSMSVVVAFPPGLVPTPAAILHERWSLARAFEVTPVTVGATAGLFTLVIIGYGLMAFAVGRDRQSVGSPTEVAFSAETDGGAPVPLFADDSSPVEFIPPEGLRPAQFGLLLHERVRTVDVSATIVDLAVRGYLRIEEIGSGRKRDYQFVRLRPDTEGLEPYEAKLLNDLVSPAFGVQLLSSHKDSFAGDLHDIVEDVYQQGQDRKWFRSRPDSARVKWRALGILLIVLSGTLIALAIWLTHLALLSLPFLLLGLLVFFGGGKMPARTPVGTGLTRRSRGFEIFIRDSEAPRARWAEQNNIFSEYLPYAIVLGCADRWAKTFEPLGAQATAAASAWYIGSDPTQPLSVNDLATSTSSFAGSAASTMSSTPASSGSSGFSGGGGGGSSGGGGGGGGGGSW